MSANWAEENLNTIRALMERASIYRRALAPVSIITGILGIIGAGAAQFTGLGVGGSSFAGYWMCVAVMTTLVGFMVMRGQAVRAGEPFWSPPTRRVAQAMLPLLLAGFLMGLLALRDVPGINPDSIRLTALWMILYGGALHAAGFFMRRGLKLFGWIYLLLGIACLFLNEFELMSWFNESRAHLLMGWAFGVNHLAYGLYLRMTSEPREME